MATNHSSAELEALVGESLKKLRLSRNIGQKDLATRAGVSVRALQGLENGEGSSLGTLVLVVRALGREDWLKTIAPVATVNPMSAVRGVQPRQRARRPGAGVSR
jgi:transcriptional regulator with XRE-family HTH domain